MRQLRRRTWLLVLSTLVSATARADDTPWETEVLRSGGRALDSGWFAFERAGSPGAAFAAADEVKTRGRPEYLGHALALEAHAAASSGDYARAAHVAREARHMSIPEEQSQLLRTGSIAWSCLALLSPDGTRPESAMEPMLTCLRRLAAQKPTTDEARLLKRRAAALAVLGNWSVSFVRRSEAKVEEQKQLEIALGTAEEAACGLRKDCALGAVLQARIYIAARESSSARAVLERMLARTTQPGRIRGLLQLTLGDVIASPQGPPEELGLPPARLTKSTLSSAGAIAAAPMVSPGARVQARDWYADAETSFKAESCPRCMADLMVRRGALALDEGDTRGAAEQFANARSAFDQLADRSAIERIAFAELAAVIASQPSMPPALAAASVELSSAQGPVAARSTVDLLLRLSERERYRDLALALQSARVASELSQEPALVDGQRESRLVLANLFRENGLAQEAAGELTKLMAMPAPDDLPGKLWTRSVARELIAVYMGLNDVHRAQDVLNVVCRRCEDPDLLLTMRRYSQVVRAGKRTGDRLVEALGRAGQGDTRGALPLVEAEVESLLGRIGNDPVEPAKDLPFLRDYWDSADPATGATLRAQAIRRRIARVVVLAMDVNAYQAAERLVSGSAPHFAKSPLHVDDRPWVEPALMARIEEGLGRLATARKLSDAAVTAIEDAYPVLPASFDESDPQEGDGYVYQDAIRIRVLQGLVGQTNALDSLEFLERWRARRATSRLIRARATTALSGAGQPATEPTARDGALLTSVDSAKPLAELLEEAAPNAALVHGTQVAVMMQGVIAASRGALLTSYYLDRHLAVAWVLGANETVHLRRLPTDATELGKLRNSLLDTMKRRDPRWRKTAQELYERLITPIEDLLPVIGAHAPVGIVPFSVLHGLPFQALVRRDQPAVDRYAFFYLPSLRSYPRMLELAARRSRVGPTIAFGVNDIEQRLTRAEDEATRVASKGFGFTHERATLTSFREQQSAAAVLHVSAHAEIDEVNPLATSFRLSDGQLHLSELLSMRPTARLLTLSAAHGLRGSRLRGDEMTGLSAAALAGGVPSVLTSAWLVDDAAATAVMRSFYRRMEKGTNLAVALAEAQQEVASTASPAVWSAFSLWGADQ